VAQRSGGQVGESSMRRSYGILDAYSGRHLALPLVRHDKPTCGRRSKRPQSWVGRSRGGPNHVGFHPGDCHVGPKVGMGVFTVFLASYLMVVGSWIFVLAFDWSRVCFFGSMRCHGHVDSCVAARRRVSCCRSHRAHMISCAYLFHPNSKVGK
jgi:hypothetical protein